MKILQVNKFHYLRGGAENYYLELSKKLIERGHQVANFSTIHPQNESSKWSPYFVSSLDFSALKFKDYFKLPFRMIYSLEAKRKFKSLINEFSPDIIHLHNIYHHLSPSIIDVAYKKNIPVVLHLHDYKMICPNYQLYNGKNYLWNCCGNKSWNCFREKCFKNSYMQSFLVSLEYYIHHRILNIYRKKISLFIAPSEYIRSTLIKYNFNANKIQHIGNFVLPEKFKKPNLENSKHLLYFGRLSVEKGIDDLLRALKVNKLNLPLKIVGDGPEMSKLKKLSNDLNLSKQVEFTGALFGGKLNEIMDGAKAILIPSVWPENMPFSLLESLARGKIVLASKVGGLPEIIKDGENGFLFSPHNIDSLSQAIDKLGKLSLLDLEKMETNAYNSAKNLDIESHTDKILNLYSKLI
jgi:glycosyltransferase involved in cell wall biosynthesis